MEKFEITDRDLETEFDISSRRKYTSKEDRIYGCFAENEEYSSVSYKPRKPYTTPVDFVKGGVQAPNEEDKHENSDAEDDHLDDLIENSSDEECRPVFKHGKSVAPSSTYRTVERTEIAGLRSRGFDGPTAGIGGIGHWEKHTRGIGAKLLKQMGFTEGGGLGKNLQGIAAPLEARKRKGRAALGSYITEASISSADGPRVEGGQDKVGRRRARYGQWRKSERSDTRPEYVGRSVSEVLAEGRAKPCVSSRSLDSSEIARVKVIDMTRRDTRILSGYHEIHSNSHKSAEDFTCDISSDITSNADQQKFNLPELMHNINLLVDICEQDIVRGERALSHEKDRIITLQHEEQQMSEVIESSRTSVSTAELFQLAVDKLDKHAVTSDDPYPLHAVIKLFKQLKNDYTAEFIELEFDYLAVEYIFPLIDNYLRDWDVMNDSEYALDVFAEVEQFLKYTDNMEMDAGVLLDVYQRLVWDSWMPCFRRAISAWEPRTQTSLVTVLSKWKPLLPDWIWQNVCAQTVVPRLQAAADAWDPLTDTIPVHSWVHPWIHTIPPVHMQTVLATILQKLGRALQAWHPSDKSARLIIEPWTKVIAAGQLESFLITHILPKLQESMQQLVIDPKHQNLDHWKWVMDWKNVISSVHFVSLLDKIFFPKWLQCLVNWLNMNPTYDEVSEWYSGWKSIIPDSFLAQPTVRDHLNTGLQFMNRSSINTVPITPSGGSSRVLLASPATTIYNQATQSRNTSSVINFVDLLQQRCQEQNVSLSLVSGRSQEGRQVYKCGSLHIYIEKNVIFVNEKGIWVPSSLQSVLDRAV